MRFQFFEIAMGNQAMPELRTVSPEFDIMVSNVMGGDAAAAREAIEHHFQQIVDTESSSGQVLLFTRTLGEPPGSIIAVETVDTYNRRRLTWAWSGDDSIQI